jgi:alanyl-tRNA synthetase
MNSSEIRSRFLRFFEKRGHAVIPSASLITPDEKGVTNSTLFNTAGMQPLVPYLLGKTHPAGKRLVDVQKCLRTVDIDYIRDKTHTTFFEMLGNWSLGDYFKEDAIKWSYEFLTDPKEGLGLDPSRLYVTVFEGDQNAKRDDEAAGIWQASGVPKNRIYFKDASANWWPAVKPGKEDGWTGPTGPCSEMFYDITKEGLGDLTPEEFEKADNEQKVVEIWNDVFMEFEKVDGKIVAPLAKKNVDTGAGFERLAAVLQKVDNIYDTDLLKPVMDLMKNPTATLTGKRIVADHLKASTFLISDGVTPSNSDRGYILRRLIRRAIINTTDRKLDEPRISKFVDTLVSIYQSSYPELATNKDYIKKVLLEESTKFSEALTNGIREFNRVAASGTISGSDAFKLFSSYGLPIDVTRELAKEKGLPVDLEGYEAQFKNHQSLSRSGAEQKFKGGLGDANDPMVICYHTATHLLHQALHDVLGENEGNQKGSNITAERLRFDFTGTKLTDEQKKKVEDIVNEKIRAGLPMNNVTMPKEQAEKTGARHFFGEKYGDEISIYFIGNDLSSAYSKEFCGGPHVQNTKELSGPEGTWKFKIQKEDAVSQGVRRIKAVLE